MSSHRSTCCEIARSTVGFDHALTLDAQPHQDSSGHEDRRADAAMRQHSRVQSEKGHQSQHPRMERERGVATRDEVFHGFRDMCQVSKMSEISIRPGTLDLVPALVHDIS